MEQTKALNALEPFLALTKSASSPRAAADLITRATSHPNTFVFAELLSTPAIQSLSQSSDYASHLNLLQIFSYGTYNDYHSSPTPLPPLNAAQTLKLRQLSFLTLAKTPNSLSYASLLSALGLTSTTELETIVIASIYAGLVSGTLDPYHQTVLLSSVSPLRDVPPNSIPSMLTTLSAWSARCTDTLADLERQIAAIKATSLARQKKDAEWAAIVEDLMTEQSPGGGAQTQQMKGMLDHVGQKLRMAASKREKDRISDEDHNTAMEVDDESLDEGERRGSKAAKKKGGIFEK